MSENPLNVTPGKLPMQVAQNPKIIAAHSQAQTSFWRLMILGGVLISLGASLVAAMICRTEYVKDVLLVISTISGFVAGSNVRDRDGVASGK